MSNRFGTLLVIVALQHSAFSLAAQDGVVSGQVVRAHDRLPVRFASVQVRTPEGAAVGSAISDTEGRFTIGSLPPGRYAVSAAADGYATGSWKGFNDRARFVAVAAGEERHSLVIALARGGVITGRVVDTRGRAVEGIPVHALVSEYRSGREVLRQAGGARVSDDRGRFRLFGLDPGTYRVAAVPGPFGTEPGGNLPRHVVTYYPSTSSPASAEPIEVGADRESPIGDLTVRPIATASLSGRLLDSAGLPLGGGEVVLAPIGDVLTSLLPTTMSGVDGAFRFDDIAPATYVLQTLPGPSTKGEFGSTVVVLAPGPHSLALRLRPPAVASARVVFADAGPDFTPAELTVALRATDLGQSPLARGARARVLADWTVEFTGVWGPHVVHVTPPAGWMLKRLHVGGDDVIGKPFDVASHDATPLTIVLTRVTATISGVVLDAHRTAVPDVSIVIFSSDGERRVHDARAVRVTRADAAGRFRVDGLPSDTYRVAACSEMPRGDWPPRPSWLESLVPIANTVTVREGREYSVTLRSES